MSNLTFSNLKWALASNQHNLVDMLFEAYRDNHDYLAYLDELVCFLRRHKCENIRKKLENVGNLFWFQSVCSELEIARALIERGKSVTFLPDDYGDMVSPPDLIAKNDQIEAYVEVKRIIEDEASNTILDFLRKFLRKYSYPYIVDLEMNDTMSIPVTRWQDIDKKEKLAKKALKELESHITKIDPQRLPTEIKTSAGRFKVYTSPSGKGHPGVFRTPVIKIPTDKLVEKIRHDVITKAKKRDRWSNEHRVKYYLVAIDFEQIFYHTDDLDIALIGNTTTYLPPLPMPKTPETHELKTAIERGWEDFLREKYVLPRDRTSLDFNKRGIFFTEPVVRNVSGVLGKFRKALYFVPNPFAFAEINDPRLVFFI